MHRANRDVTSYITRCIMSVNIASILSGNKVIYCLEDYFRTIFPPTGS